MGVLSFPTRWSVSRWGLTFVVCLALVAGAVVIQADYLASAVTHEKSWGPPRVDSDRVVVVFSTRAYPGDRVVVDPGVMQAPPELGRTEFFVAEGGEGARWLAGGAGQQVYASREAAQPHALGQVELARPATAASQPALDLVWIYHFESRSSAPGTTEARELYGQNVQRAMLDATWGFRSGVLSATALSMQPFWYALETLFLGGAAVTGAGWIWKGRAQRRELPESDTEALVGLVQRGAGFLEGVRNLLWVVGILLVFLFLFAAPEIDTGYLGALAPATPSAVWEGWVLVLMVTVFLAALAVWGTTLWRVDRALRQWRKRSAQAPDLG